jgi:alpha-1,3-mannosyltransferase
VFVLALLHWQNWLTMDFIRQGLAIAQDPKHTSWISPLLILGDAFLSLLIVHKISCTSMTLRL